MVFLNSHSFLHHAAMIQVYKYITTSAKFLCYSIWTLDKPGWLEENVPAVRVLLMMEVLEGVPYRLAEPRAAKPNIESTVNTSCGACPADLLW